MKNMLLTAVAVGTVLAAMIVYVERKNRSRKILTDVASTDAEKEYTGESLPDRPAFHAMG